jgi:hypothetical protein
VGSRRAVLARAHAAELVGVVVRRRAAGDLLQDLPAGAVQVAGEEILQQQRQAGADVPREGLEQARAAYSCVLRCGRGLIISRIQPGLRD